MTPKSPRLSHCCALLMLGIALMGCEKATNTKTTVVTPPATQTNTEATPAPATSSTTVSTTTTTTGSATTPPQLGLNEKISIAVIPKGTAHPYWKTVHAGADMAAKELGVDITWNGPANESDRQQQIDMVNTYIAKGVRAIVLAPLDSVALIQPVEQAVANNIPVIIIDSALNSDKQASFIATNNREGGREAANMLGEAMGGTGKAIMMRYNPGSASTEDREEGFLEQMKAKYPNIELVSTNQYGGVTKESAAENGQGLLNKFGKDIQGIFCPNESSVAGMLAALENTGFAGKIKFVGFDASPTLTEGMKKGFIHGLVAQDPFKMGELGVRTAVKAVKGGPVEKKIDTSLIKVTPQNLETPEIQKQIAPELAGM